MPIIDESAEQSIARAIPKLIEAEVKKIVDEEAEAAAKRVKTRVGELTGRVGASVAAALKIDIEGAEIVIRLNGQLKPW